MIVFAIQQHESVIDIHMSPPSCTLLPLPSPTHPSRSSEGTDFGFPASSPQIILLHSLCSHLLDSYPIGYILLSLS